MKMKITYIFKKQVLHQQNNAPKKPAVVFLNKSAFLNKSVEWIIQWHTQSIIESMN